MWVDEVPLSRPKRNIARDFADGVLTAEIVHHYFPRIVEVHNYPSANSYAQKMYNWQTLNARVNKNEEAESLPQYLYLLLLPESQEVRAQGAAELSPQLHRRPQPRPLLLLRAQREQSRPAAARARRAVAEVTPVGRACR